MTLARVSHCTRARTAGLRIAAILAALPAIALAEPGVAPAIELERLGEPVIEAANNYSENTRLRVRLRYPAGHARAGEMYAGYAGPIRIEEWNGRIYDGQYGASLLPMTLFAPQGEVEFTLKSLARYTMYDLRNMPVPQIAAYVEANSVRVQVPQWVDADRNDKTDWLEARVEHILNRARDSTEPAVTQAARALRRWEQSYRRDCGGFDEVRPDTIMIAPACLDWDGGNAHRLNTNQELSATVLHELHHVWTQRLAAARPARMLPKAAPPRRAEPVRCGGSRPDSDECVGNVWVRDPRYLEEEAAAEAFAERYKHLLP